MSSKPPLASLVQKYLERNPVDAARDLETLDEPQAIAVLRALPPTSVVQLFPFLQAGHAAAFLREAPAQTVETVVKHLKAEQATTVLLRLPAEARSALLERLPEDLKRQLRELLVYPENSAGRIMTTDFLALRADMQVKDAIQRIRTLAARSAPATYAYVVDEASVLLGVLNMRDLLLAAGDSVLRSIMKTDVFAVNGFLDREEVAHELSRRRFFAAPVVDAERHLLGVVKTDELIADVQEEATEDLLKMVGAGEDEQAFSPIGFSMRKRLPWLHLNLLTAFLAAAVVALFESVIAEITVLAVLLPVVAGQGGNAGAQSLAVVMRGLVMRQIRPHNAWKAIMKEGSLGAVNGLIIGVVTAVIAWAWHGNPFLGLVIGLAMLANLIAAGLSGAGIPILMKALGRDPAQSSNIILTTVTDVVGFFAFLGFAVVFKHQLL